MIHGGGNVTGHKGTYDFSRFAARGQVVVVVINYRLGPFGWFVHPALNGADLKTASLANFGTGYGGSASLDSAQHHAVWR